MTPRVQSREKAVYGSDTVGAEVCTEGRYLVAFSLHRKGVFCLHKSRHSESQGDRN